MGQRVNGRPAQITLADIRRAGRQLGLSQLTVQGVASALGVSAAALYRHVDGKAGLEQLVGESLLAELRIPNAPNDDAATQLLRFACALREFVLQHPGMIAYLQTLFPRGTAGARLLADQIVALTDRGYSPDVASVLSNVVASLAIAQAAAAERHDSASLSAELRRQREESFALLHTPGVLAEAHANLAPIDFDGYFRMVMKACIGGILAAAPAGASVAEVMATLHTDIPLSEET